MTTFKMRTTFSCLALVGALASTGCASIRESVRNDDRPVRSYNEQSKVARWTYRVAVDGSRPGETGNGSPEGASAVPVSLAVTRHHPCETRVHNVVDRTQITEREWDASAANSRTSLYFWGAVGVAASVGGGIYLLSKADTDSDKAGAVALIGGGSLASILVPGLNELRAANSTNHIGPVDEVKRTEPGECDAEPVRDARVRLWGSYHRVVAEITTDSSGRGQARVPRLAILAGGAQLTIDVGGENAGTTDALAPTYQALAEDDAAWKAARTDACSSPKTEKDCDGVQKYVKAYPAGLHASDAKQIIDGASPEITRLRRSREIEAAVTEQQEEKAGISISNVRLRTDDPAIGRASSGRYVEIKIDATVRRKQPGGMDLWARTVCQVGDKRMVDEQSALENFSGLNAGETKEIEFAPFINKPLAREPGMCEVYFGTEAIGGGGVAVRRFCYVPRTRVRSGACTWPTP